MGQGSKRRLYPRTAAARLLDTRRDPCDCGSVFRRLRCVKTAFANPPSRNEARSLTQSPASASTLRLSSSTDVSSARALIRNATVTVAWVLKWTNRTVTSRSSRSTRISSQAHNAALIASLQTWHGSAFNRARLLFRVAAPVQRQVLCLRSIHRQILPVSSTRSLAPSRTLAIRLPRCRQPAAALFFHLPDDTPHLARNAGSSRWL